MKRGRPPERTTPLRAKSWWNPRRSKPMAQRSAKTIARAPERDAVRAAVIARDRQCQLWWHTTACGGPLDVHEVVRRGQQPGAQYDPDLCIALCRVHHQLDERIGLASRLGIRVPGRVWDRLGWPAVFEATRIRVARGVGRDPGLPFWWRDFHRDGWDEG